MDLGLAHLDCRHGFYTGSVLLTDDAPPPHIPPPPYIPPPPSVTPATPTPQPANNTPPPTNDTKPEPVGVSGMSRATKLGITLAVLALAALAGVALYAVVIKPRVGLRNTIESEGYAML